MPLGEVRWEQWKVGREPRKLICGRLAARASDGGGRVGTSRVSKYLSLNLFDRKSWNVEVSKVWTLLRGSLQILNPKAEHLFEIWYWSHQVKGSLKERVIILNYLSVNLCLKIFMASMEVFKFEVSKVWKLLRGSLQILKQKIAKANFCSSCKSEAGERLKIFVESDERCRRQRHRSTRVIFQFNQLLLSFS